jgi:hypothetical protein
MMDDGGESNSVLAPMRPHPSLMLQGDIACRLMYACGGFLALNGEAGVQLSRWPAWSTTIDAACLDALQSCVYHLTWSVQRHAVLLLACPDRERLLLGLPCAV